MSLIKTEWDKVLEVDMPLNVMLNVLPTKGNLVYEYNPFRNYRLTKDLYWYDNKYLTPEELKSNKYKLTWSDETKSWDNVPDNMTDPILYERGLLVDFITDEFKFSLEHPVHIVPQYSYDGSVNLIINDGLNKPKLINSRFSATGKNTYEIVDRKGSNDTNIYDLGELFDIDTSLYKIVDKIPKIEFLGTSMGGNLKVGNYYFYFKLADADGNETDFVGESGLVSIFIGEGTYNSVHTGIKNENSAKLVEFYLSNIDGAYDYITIYYSRSTAELNNNIVTEYKKIIKKFPKSASKLVITGFEETEDITVTDINTNYNLVDAAKTSVVCQNMLFLGNVKKPEIPYEELQDLSLRILPFLGTEEYDPELDKEYSSGNPEKSYINSNYIYNKTGYWPDELYRFGIVYILPNGLLTPVFNIRGGIKIGAEEKGFTNIPIENENKERIYVKYNDKTFYINEDHKQCVYTENTKDNVVLYDNKDCYDYENVKGVCSFAFKNPNNENPDIYYVRFYIPTELREKLKNYVKGYFFVRQTRIPSIIALGITIGIDKESGLPTIPTAEGMLSRMSDTLEKSHVETENINGINYISEGFLKRYTFRFKRKTSSLWGSMGKIMGIAALAVGAAACLLTPGGQIVTALGIKGLIGAAATAASSASGIVAIGASIGLSTTATLAVAGAVTGAVVAGVAGTVAATALDIHYADQRDSDPIASTQELLQAVMKIGDKKQLRGKATVAPPGYKLEETDDSRTLIENFEERIIIKDPTKNRVNGIICPDYTINQAYYNQIFTGNEHYITTDYRQSDTKEESSGECYFTNDYRHFYINKYGHYTSNINRIHAKIIGVPDSAPCIGIDNQLFRGRAGEAEEAWRFKYIGDDITTSGSDLKKINTDIVRGNFSSYLAFNNNSIGPAKIVNIYIPGYDDSNLLNYINIRMSDTSTYHAITDRIDINNYDSELLGDMNKHESWHPAYRGDCYICLYTLRIIRNFNDPSAPYNTDIIDINTWRDGYDPGNIEKYLEINRGDINAVPLGMWITFLLRSSNNLNIRTLDESDVDETAMTGNPRGYYPMHPMSTEGAYKKPESLIYNKGFSKSIGDKWNVEVPDSPHIKNWFGTRIMYSDIHINDGFKNGFRTFRGTHYRDYTREYGEITKLISLESSLLCVFEHGVALIPVNERAVAGQGAGGNVYINTSNVLPENPKIISDMFGSQWPESILKVPGRTGDSPLYVYGVDTIAKKIWRTDGNTLECISDFKVQEFLNNNITLGERELTPRIGIRNVKTHYNAFKRDVMFTFYDNTYGFEEKVWNLCWNELLQKFITFYSWVPSYMENINNVPFSFDRNTSKWIATLGASHTENSFADGITLSNVLVNDKIDFDKGIVVNDFAIKIPYITNTGETKYIETEVPEDKRKKFIGVLSLSNRVLPDQTTFYLVDYSLERDIYNNYKMFDILEILRIKIPDDGKFFKREISVQGLYFKEGDDEYLEVYYSNDGIEFYLPNLGKEGDNVYLYEILYSPEALYSELYYRNSAGNAYADIDTHKLGTEKLSTTFEPMDLNAKFEEEEREWISEVLNMPYEDTAKFVGKSKSWVENDEMLTLFEALYPPETIIGNASPKFNEDNPPDNAYPCTSVGEIRNIAKGDISKENGATKVHGIRLDQHWVLLVAEEASKRKVWYNLPIFKDLTGKRPMLPENMKVNPDKIVTLLNIKANINILASSEISLSDTYYNMKASYAEGTTLINAGQYESVVAVAPKWNLLFLSTDFWKHGLAGIIDITDEIFPTYWYGKRHPFEFEVIVVNDPSVHKIFSNLELVANKAKPESFHYEIIGETYDFAKDKPNMYFRLEALKALWLYNGADITYNRDFLKVLTRQLPKSANLIHKYYSRIDSINNVEDYYNSITLPDDSKYSYKHLSGAELVYYPNRLEYRIWQHSPAVSLDDLSLDDSRSIITANCQYLEDRWKITINPILVCYKNEYSGKIHPTNSTWARTFDRNSYLPPLSIYNSPIPDLVLSKDELDIPGIPSSLGKENALYQLYDTFGFGLNNQWLPLDTSNWLNDVSVYGTNFGEALNRKELDLKDKFIKIRIRYSGEELAIIDFLNTIYRVSYA